MKNTSKSFKSIWEETNEYVIEDELDALKTFLQVSYSRGLEFMTNDYLIARKRGDLQYKLHKRCCNHKNFFMNQIKEDLMKVHKYIKNNQ